MESSGVKMKALNQRWLFSFSTSKLNINNINYSPSLSLSTAFNLFTLSYSPPSRFSTLCEKINNNRNNGYGKTYAAIQSTQPTPLSNTNTPILQVVLVSPQIPGNTGCIARTCAASSVKLHLVEPLGFQIDDAKLKRAGLDYWPYVVVKVHPSWAAFRDYFSLQEGDKRLLAFTKRGTSTHSDFSYKPGDWLVFGSETSGLPPDALLDCRNEVYGGGTIKIPMVDTYVRCLNLSVSVGIAVYEAARQLNYEQLQYSSETYINNENPFITEDIFA